MSGTTRGVVVRNQNDKTAYVRVERWRKHVLYGKVIRINSIIAVHDEENSCQVNDQVLIEEGRHISKTKTWRLKEIVVPASSRLKKDDSKTN